ncbi:MAG: ABC transporter permease [Acidimicrobiia bacterium]|nr:ABC transporter permease [Acidimicrobiia bacterium]
MTVLRLAWRDLVSDRVRSTLHIAAIAPIVAAYLILTAIAGGLRDQAVPAEAQHIVVVSPNALDPASGRLDPSVLTLVPQVGGPDVASATPMIFRPIRMADRIVQLRAAPQDTWEPVHHLALLAGSWPDQRDDIAITEGVAIAAGWNVGTRGEIFGTTFTVSALVRAPGTKFASVWMPYARAEELFEGMSGFQMVTVVPAPGADVAALRDRLDAAGGGRFAVYFESDLVAQQGARGSAADNLAAVSTVIGVAALAFCGFNLAALTLVERRRDIGIARVLGFAPRSITGLALTRGAILAVAGFALGGAAALAVLATAASTTLRSFVFVPSLPAAAWLIGITLTFGTGLAGTWLALRRAAASAAHTLLEEW